MNAKQARVATRTVLAALAAAAICIPPLVNALPVRTGAQAAPRLAGQVSTENGARLVEAVKNNDLEAVRDLVARGAGIDEGVDGDGTALIVAARLGNLPMVDALLQLGATIDKCWSGDGNPLIAASIQGQGDVVARLLQAGAYVDTICPYDETALINASRAGRLPIVKQLVERGANVNLGVWADGQRWRTPLNQARDTTVRNYLIAKGASA